MSLSKNLKRIRKENNLSQEQLADKLGVSRQAVSKWESEQAYPEMEKMVAICKMFNLNIDELLNQDVREVNENKQSKININKYIDDFLEYITKTIDMFSSMCFKTKVKCVLEQGIIIGVIALILLIVGSIGGIFIQDILMILPEKIYWIFYRIIEDIYIILCFILTTILVLHIFKIRYLDYYVIDKINDDLEKSIDNEKQVSECINVTEKEIKNNKKVYLEKKPTKIIIRDPENAGYKFISLLLRGVLFLVKLFVGIFASAFCFSLVCLCFILVLSFMFIKTGLVFIGTLFIIFSIIIFNLIILNISYNFIISKKNKKNRLALFFLASLVMIGIGSGVFVIGFTDFEIVDNYDYIEKEVIVPFRENLFIWDDYKVNYIPSDNEDLRIVYRVSSYYDLHINNHGDGIISFYTYYNDTDIMDIVREYIKNINDKCIVDYSKVEIDIYTSSDNINKINNNKLNYFG